MSGYRLTTRARTGLTNVIRQVERDFSPAVAERVLERLSRAFETVSENPSIGHVREELTRDVSVRFWSVGPTLVAYRQSNTGVEILFVERGERDWPTLLEDD